MVDRAYSEADLLDALRRADRLIEWMSGYIGKMAPGKYSDCYAELNEHGLFVQRIGLVPPAAAGQESKDGQGAPPAPAA